MSGKWKKLSSKYVYENPWIKVREDRVIRPDGKEGIYAVVEQGRGVCVIPVDENGKIWLVRQYRYIFDDDNWELVAGDVDAREEPIAAAKRELKEELRLQAETWEKMGMFRPSEGRIEQETELFIVKGLKKVNENEVEKVLDDFVIKQRKAFSLEELDEMIGSGIITCGYTITGLYFYKLYLSQSSRVQ